MHLFNILGYYNQPGHLMILYKNKLFPPKKGLHPRNTRGKRCLDHRKGELVEIIKFLNINTDYMSMNKKELCDLIERALRTIDNSNGIRSFLH